MLVRFLFAIVAACAVFDVHAAALPFAFHTLLSGPVYDGWQHGAVLAFDGDRLVVGMPDASYDVGPATFAQAGRVRVYVRSGESWLAEGADLRLDTLTGTAQAQARFGAAVALSAGRMLIGCPGCATTHAFLVQLPLPDAGAPTFWTASPPGVAVPAANAALCGIGSSVALRDDVIAVGAPCATSGGFSEYGTVSLGRFENNAVLWEDKLQYYGGENSKFGRSLALERTSILPSGYVTDLLVGAPLSTLAAGAVNQKGRAFLFRRNDNNGLWAQQQEFTLGQPTGYSFDAFGSTVALHRPSVLSGGYIALGAPGRGVSGGPPAGAVRLYRYDTGSSSYLFDGEVQYASAATDDRFGVAVALLGNRLLVGADGRAVNGFADAGSAYVYERISNGNWGFRETLAPSSGNRAFGRSIGLSATRAAVGAPLADSGGATAAGETWLFRSDSLFQDDFE